MYLAGWALHATNPRASQNKVKTNHVGTVHYFDSASPGFPAHKAKSALHFSYRDLTCSGQRQRELQYDSVHVCVATTRQRNNMKHKRSEEACIVLVLLCLFGLKLFKGTCAILCTVGVFVAGLKGKHLCCYIFVHLPLRRLKSKSK